MTRPRRVADGESGWAAGVTGAAYPAGRTACANATARTASPRARNGSRSSAARRATTPVRQKPGTSSGKAFKDVEGEPGAGRLTLNSWTKTA